MPLYLRRALPVVAEQFTGEPLTLVAAYNDEAHAGAVYSHDQDGASIARLFDRERAPLLLRVGDWIVSGEGWRVLSDAAFRAQYDPAPDEAPPAEVPAEATAPEDFMLARSPDRRGEDA